MATAKKKLCWNCEGRVSLDQENCPYCQVYLSPVNSSGSQVDHLLPPYRLVEVEEQEQAAPPPPFETPIAVAERPDSVKNAPASPLESRSFVEEGKKVLLPLALLLSGSIALFMGIVFVFFAKNGVLTLQWDATYWFLYPIAGVVLLLLGWRSFRYLDE